MPRERPIATPFLTRIDGLLYGDDPKQGVIEGNTFVHPELRLTFTVPNGYYMVNGTDAVSINGQGGQAQLSTARYSGDLDTYVRQVFQQIGGQQRQLAPQSVQRTTINGLPVTYGSARVNYRPEHGRRRGRRLRVLAHTGVSFRER